MNAKTLILAILKFQEATGYEIRKSCTDGPFSYFGDISYGSIYPTLAKLEAEGLVVGRMEQDAGKPERKVFSLTDAGEDVLFLALQEPPAKDKFKSEFLLIAAMAENNTPQAVARAIDMRIDHIRDELAMIAKHQSDCPDGGGDWVSRYGMHVMSADLEYLQNNRESLIAIAGAGKNMPAAAE